MPLNQPSPVAKTAFDALQAKRSAAAAGYRPMVVANHDVYESYLERVSAATAGTTTTTPRLGRRRGGGQTPLVNAGYAARTLAVSSAVRAYVVHHQVTWAPRIQIVLLGCGVDVIGLWAHSLDPTLVSIVEVDTGEVCAVKREILQSQNLVVVDDRDEHSDEGRVDVGVNEGKADTNIETGKKTAAPFFFGTIVPVVGRGVCKGGDSVKMPPQTTSASTNNYVLVSADLMDISALDASFQRLSEISGFDTKSPTLVISELVLSYLPPASTERLLSWCSLRLCQASSSAFVALEPLGFDARRGDTAAPTFSSVAEGYRRDYCQKFHAKMVRGNNSQQKKTNKNSIPEGTTDEGDDDDDDVVNKATTIFHTIGNSVQQVSRRLEQAGFHVSSTTNLGESAAIAAASTPSKTLVCTEIFDEHAALVLHLQSYVLACGMTGGRTSKSHRLHRTLCPWEGPNPCDSARAALPFVDIAAGMLYTEIEAEEELAVRNLFEKTYATYIEGYPAIRKLVKGVIQKEFCRGEHGRRRQAQCMDDHPMGIASPSVIGTFYRSLGGIFLVALRYDRSPEGGDEFCDTGSSTCRVVGCVGVRKLEDRKIDPDDDNCLEIYRLAVDETCRGMGVANNLLQAVERFANVRQSPKLVANTLTILEAACNLYESFGYEVENETPLGATKLVTRTYVKSLV